MTYSEKLKDPRWQRRRLEILQRDEFSCVWCGDDKSTLHVHHLSYSADPWDTPPEELITLCETCHESDHAERARAQKALLESIRKLAFDYGDVYSLAAGFHHMKKFHVHDVMSAVIHWALRDENIMHELRNRYLEHVKNLRENPPPDIFDDLDF